MSNEIDIDDDPDLCIGAKFHQIQFGEIDAAVAAASGISTGEIRLYNGWPGPKGWGHRHVLSTPGRVEKIQRIGFADEKAFAWEIAQNFTVIHEGDGGRAQRIMIYMPYKGMWPGLALDWRGTCWSITTMLPFHSIGASYAQIYEKGA